MRFIKRGRVGTLALTGRLGVEDCSELKALLLKLQREGKLEKLIVNMAKLSSLDGAALQLLSQVGREWSDEGRSIQWFDPSTSVARRLALANLV